jgi:hypothetical protein
VGLLAATAASAQTDAQYAPWGSDIAIENRPCCESIGRAREQEAAVLAATDGRANRQGRILRLRLEGGRTLRIVDCADTSVCDIENVRVHRLAGWWPSRGYYVIAVDGYAEQKAYLVRAQDGLLLRTLAPPILSPHERYAIATDLLMPRGPGSTEVLDMGGDPPARVPFRKSTTCPALLAAGSLPHWIDDSNASFSDAMLPANEPAPKELSLRIGGGAAEWVCRY